MSSHDEKISRRPFLKGSAMPASIGVVVAGGMSRLAYGGAPPSRHALSGPSQERPALLDLHPVRSGHLRPVHRHLQGRRWGHQPGRLLRRVLRHIMPSMGHLALWPLACPCIALERAHGSRGQGPGFPERSTDGPIPRSSPTGRPSGFRQRDAPIWLRPTRPGRTLCATVASAWPTRTS